MPRYVTESGYEEFEEVRTRVGHEPPLPQKIWLVDGANAGVRELKYDTLPGIADDPLADLRKAAGKPPLEGNRAVRIETNGEIRRAHICTPVTHEHPVSRHLHAKQHKPPKTNQHHK